MKDILISIVVPILTSLISYFAARHQANTELQKVKEQQNAEIQKIKEQYALEIEKIKIEMEKQAELYERNAQTDLTKEFIGELAKSPEIKKLMNQLATNEFKKHLSR
jgi:hypothetical protein